MTLRSVLSEMMALSEPLNTHKDVFYFLDAGVRVSATTQKRQTLCKVDWRHQTWPKSNHEAMIQAQSKANIMEEIAPSLNSIKALIPALEDALRTTPALDSRLLRPQVRFYLDGTFTLSLYKMSWGDGGHSITFDKSKVKMGSQLSCHSFDDIEHTIKRLARFEAAGETEWMQPSKSSRVCAPTPLQAYLVHMIIQTHGTLKRSDLPRTLPQMGLCANRMEVKKDLKEKMDMYL